MSTDKKQIRSKKSMKKDNFQNIEIIFSEEMELVVVHFGLIMQLENCYFLHN